MNEPKILRLSDIRVVEMLSPLPDKRWTAYVITQACKRGWGSTKQEAIESLAISLASEQVLFNFEVKS